MAQATYGGIDIFGPWVSIDHVPNPSAAQISAFFGVTGTVSQYGGGRGRAFTVKGVSYQPTFLALRTYESAFQSYADGVARTLVDPLGYSWANVIFKGEFQYQGPFAFRSDGVVRAYRAVFHGLS